MLNPLPIKTRYSGHETFVCRYAWLPKVVSELSKNPMLFLNEDEAMISLGIGKNMVRSAKFWAEAAQIIEDRAEGGHQITSFGQMLLGEEWHDPYLERPETLWLLHWKISTHPTRPLFHWHQMLNHWHRPEFSEAETLQFFEKGLPKDKDKTSKRTLSDGFRVFVNTYVPTRGKKNEIAEDNLDCPLVELGLIRLVSSSNGALYSFNITSKPAITPELFAYCVYDFWINSPKYQGDESISFRAVCSEAGSPGQIFKLPEATVTTLLEEIGRCTGRALLFEESHAMKQLTRGKKTLSSADLLEAIYSQKS